MKRTTKISISKYAGQACDYWMVTESDGSITNAIEDGPNSRIYFCEADAKKAARRERAARKER